jgi:hypothetical protein
MRPGFHPAAARSGRICCEQTGGGILDGVDGTLLWLQQQQWHIDSAGTEARTGWQ